MPGYADVPVWLQAEGTSAGLALYAALFEGSKVTRLDLYDLPATHHDGPIFLNVLRVTDVPLTVGMVMPQSKVVIYDNDVERWSLPTELASRNASLAKQLQVRKRP